MHYFEFSDVNAALPRLAAELLNNGEEVGSRLGERVNELTHVAITLAEPTNRYVIVPGRKASLPAQVAETVWMLQGRDDIGWLSNYLPRAADFSDDGSTWRGAYGPRLRRFGSSGGGVDQLAHVVRLLSEDPLSRRAVIAIYDPEVDTKPGKDIPCNDFIQFTSRLGELDMHVFTRSNDLIWGWSGINAFEWSALQEIVAGMLGAAVGKLHFSIGSLHVYDRHWKKADRIAETSREDYRYFPSPGFDANVLAQRDLSLDDLLDLWMKHEAHIRLSPHATHYNIVESFPEPMLRSWLAVVAWYWTGDPVYLDPYLGSALTHAALELPAKGEQPFNNGGPLKAGNTPTFMVFDESTVYPAPESPLPQDFFVRYVSELHATKHKAYGDSWKRRGEQISILANVARKVDRLGVDDDTETSADTAIDLLVYLLKYRLWLTDEHDVAIPEAVIAELPYAAGTKYSDGTAAVDVLLGKVPDVVVSDDELRHMEKRLRGLFEELQRSLDDNPGDVEHRALVAETMAHLAGLVARTRWVEDLDQAGERAGVQR